MANINFRLRKVKQSNFPILIRLIIHKSKEIQVKTQFVINPNDWSNTSGLPKQNNSNTKKLYSDLKKLELFVFDKLNESQSKGEVINRYWLENVISNCFGRLSTDDLENNLLTHCTQYIIDNANTKKIRGTSRIGLSSNRVKSYVTFKNLIERYEKVIKKEIRLTDINKSFVDKFIIWLIQTNEYSVNYSGKTIDNLKTICTDSESRGIKVNDYVHKIESFKEDKENKFIVTLNFDELEIIKNKQITNERLINVRKWLLIGCELGQRGGDLMKFTPKNIRYSGTTMYVDIYQQKTKKTVTVPIHSEYIEQMLKNEFPYKISMQKFNDYLKALCEFCNINEITKGKKFIAEKHRKVLGNYKKHELISSHSLRRSFATNYYKSIPTPILMEITGHSKESMFLEYIGKHKDKDENANLFLKLVKEMNNNLESKLKAI